MEVDRQADDIMLNTLYDKAGLLLDGYQFSRVTSLSQTDRAVGTISQLFDDRVPLHDLVTREDGSRSHVHGSSPPSKQ